MAANSSVEDEYGHRDERDDDPNQPAAERIAEAIERDVDDRLGRPLFRGGQRRVEELVAGAEP